MDLKKNFTIATIACVVSVYVMYFIAVATSARFELAGADMDIPVFMFAAFPIGAALVA